MDMHHDNTPAPLLARHAPTLRDLITLLGTPRVLDLACGQGRNGLFAASLGCSVLGVDANDEALATARKAAESAAGQAEFVRMDMENDPQAPREVLASDAYDVVLVFRYLHRPLLPRIARAVRPGGLLIYQTFTVDHPDHSPHNRPRNPDFLLQHSELAKAFGRDYTVLDVGEGCCEGECLAHFVGRRRAR